jgi:gas vesicle protein
MRKISRFFSGLLLGSLVGAALALLLAPASGDELRKKLQGEVERIQSEVQQAAEDRRAELEQQLSALRAPRKPV